MGKQRKPCRGPIVRTKKPPSARPPSCALSRSPGGNTHGTRSCRTGSRARQLRAARQLSGPSYHEPPGSTKLLLFDSSFLFCCSSAGYGRYGLAHHCRTAPCMS
jgi:hypothetical protein